MKINILVFHKYYDLLKEVPNLDCEKLDCLPHSLSLFFLMGLKTRSFSSCLPLSPSLFFFEGLKGRSFSSSPGPFGRPGGAEKGVAIGGFSGVTGGGLSLAGRA